MTSSGRCHTPRRSFVVAEARAARVVTEHPHPHAHLIRIAVVEAGDRRWRVVYGGTRRLTVGDVVPVATPGTRLTAASGLRLPPLRARNFRGVRSEAMLCSSDELGWTRNGPDEVLVLDDSHEVGALVRRLSGRCHGPGCTREAKTEFWCSEACQARWDRQLAEADEPRPVGPFRLHDVSFVGQPLTSEWTVRVAIDGRLSEDSARTLPEAADRAVELVGEMTEGGEPQFEELPPALDGDTEERVCRARTAPVATIDSVRRDEDGLHVTGRWLPLPPDPSRGWLSRTLDRLFGRPT